MATNTTPITCTNWTQRHPQTVAFFNTLNQHQIDWGIYCGSSAQILTGNRESDDIDIVIRDKDFWSVVSLIPTNASLYQEKNATVSCGDEKELNFPRRSICFWLDGQEIEVMASTTASYKGHKYHLSMSDFSAANRLMFEAGKAQIYISHPFDTIALKSILQRGPHMGKHDAEDIAALAKAYPIDPIYARKRASEIQLRFRELDFLAMCGVDIMPTPVQTGPLRGILYAH